LVHLQGPGLADHSQRNTDGCGNIEGEFRDRYFIPLKHFLGECMMKRKFVWIGVLVCICLLAGQMTLNATGVDSKTTVKKTGQAMTTTSAASSVAVSKTTAAKSAAILTPLSTKYVETGASSDVVMPTGVTASATPSSLVKDASGRMTELDFETVDLEESAIHRSNNSLDDQCDLLNFSGTQIRYLAAWFSNGISQIATFYDAANCPTNPGYNFKIDSVEVDFYNNATGLGTLTYKVKIMCPTSGTDSCSGPGNVLAESAVQTLTRTASGFSWQMVPINACVNQKFFVAVEYLTWSGPTNSCPSVFWDATNTRPSCMQWFYWDPWITHEALFAAPNNVIGYAYIDVFGNTHDACTATPCQPVTGACCDHSTGDCAVGVLETECTGLNQTFTPDITDCRDLDPACSRCIPPTNGLCANAIALTEGVDACGNGVCDLYDCTEDIQAVWYSFTLTDVCSDVTVSYCGTNSANVNAWLSLFDGCICAAGTPIDAAGYNLTDCPNGQVTIFYTDVPAGTYYVGVHPDLFDAYCVQYTAEPCPTCEFTCTNNEGEPDCAAEYVDVYNGGCNSVPPIWQTYTAGSTICGESGNFTVAGVDNRDTDWYLLNLATEQYFTWKIVTDFAAQVYLLSPGSAGYECVADSIGLWAGATTTRCDTLTIEGCLPAGAYWLFVAPATTAQGTPCGTPYYFYTTTGECPACVPDYVNDLNCDGFTGTGNTTGATDDCEFAYVTQDSTPPTHLDEIWQFNVLVAGDYRFSLCTTGISWDSFVFLTDACCGGTILNDIATSDDGCGVGGGLSRTTCIPLTVGTYYFMVEGWQSTDFGAYTLTVECCTPCVYTCTDTELEPVCYDGYDDTFNAGCNMWPVPPVASQNFNNAGPWPQTVCGSSGTHLDGGGNPVRDTDWYEFNLADTALVTYSGISSFPMTILIVQDTSAALACSSLVLDSDVADPCSTASLNLCLRPGRYFAWVSVSSGLDAPCGSKYEITLDLEYDGCVLLPPAPEICPEEYTQYGQLFTGTSAGTSEVSQGYQRFDNFSGVLEPICDVHWWGIEQVYEGGWGPCHEIFMDFNISFHADSSGYPQGVPVCSYVRTVSGAPTTRVFNGDPIYYYETVLNIDPELCCELENGWISIQGASSPDCWFLWHTSADGNLSSALASDGVWQANDTEDLAFCLTQAPPPCDPATDLTVYLTTGGGNAILRWIAPQAQDWKVYKSTDPNNDGDITDASYVYLTTVTGSGAMEWTDPAGYDPYVNYIVVPTCYEP
jgi:hypothetical protein